MDILQDKKEQERPVATSIWAQSKVDFLAKPVNYFILQVLLARHPTKALHQAGIILLFFQFNYKQSKNVSEF